MKIYRNVQDDMTNTYLVNECLVRTLLLIGESISAIGMWSVTRSWKNITRLFLTVSMVVLTAMPLKAQERLVFSTIDSAVETVAERVLREAYQQLGIDIQVKQVPAKRALMMSNSGETDGELYRVANIEKTFKNLIMIPVPVYVMEGVAATQHAEFAIWDPEHLKPFRVGWVRGIYWSEKLTTGLDEMVVSDYETLLKMLVQGRMDVVLGARLTLLEKLSELDIESVSIVEPPLTEIELFHYLHRKHISLVPNITEVLQNMKQENRMSQIKQEVVSELTHAD